MKALKFIISLFIPVLFLWILDFPINWLTSLFLESSGLKLVFSIIFFAFFTSLMLGALGYSAVLSLLISPYKKASAILIVLFVAIATISQIYVIWPSLNLGFSRQGFVDAWLCFILVGRFITLFIAALTFSIADD